MFEVLRNSLAQLPDRLAVPTLPARGGSLAFAISLRPPGSKSLANRALLLAALSEGRSVLRGVPDGADDVVQMERALTALGATLRTISNGAGGRTIEVEGVAGEWRVPAEGVRLDVHHAGTAARFLGGAALLSPAPVTIDGSPRLRERPIAQLGEALRRLGAGVEYLDRPGCLPMRIMAGAARQGIQGTLDLSTTQSSQFISSLLMLGPWLAGGLTLRLIGAVTSSSYVAMTLGLLGRLQATVQYSENMRVMRVGPPREQAPSETPLAIPMDLSHGPARHGLAGFEYDIEPDASGATYFWAAAAMTPGARCRVLGLGGESLQGDARFPLLLERMGARISASAPGTAREDERFIEVEGPVALRPVLADMTDMPDAVLALAAAACFAPGSSILRGVRTLRVKESDRIAALRAELGKVGVQVISPVAGDEDVMTLTPPQNGIDTSAADPVEFDTYNDHRVAMSLALLGLRRAGVVIRNPACVGKTYPDYWRDFAGMYA